MILPLQNVTTTAIHEKPWPYVLSAEKTRFDPHSPDGASRGFSHENSGNVGFCRTREFQLSAASLARGPGPVGRVRASVWRKCALTACHASSSRNRSCRRMGNLSSSMGRSWLASRKSLGITRKMRQCRLSVFRFSGCGKSLPLHEVANATPKNLGIFGFRSSGLGTPAFAGRGHGGLFPGQVRGRNRLFRRKSRECREICERNLQQPRIMNVG
jgi:hypothetical protein